MSSSDGFCSTLTFSPGELGEIYVPDSSATKPGFAAHTSISLSSQNTPIPTPTSCVAPPSPFPGLSHHRAPSNPTPVEPSATTMAAISARPSSPTRSNSTSSVATQSTAPHLANNNTGTVISNPPLVAGSMPSITAGSSTTAGSFVAPSPLHMTTPPQTPRSAASSVSGMATTTSGIKRDAGVVSEDETGKAGDKTSLKGTASSEAKDTVGVHVAKKRRIAPTLVEGPNK